MYKHSENLNEMIYDFCNFIGEVDDRRGRRQISTIIELLLKLDYEFCQIGRNYELYEQFEEYLEKED